MFLADYHMHTNFSIDSEAPMEDMIVSAINKGMSEIAITDHVDFDTKYYPVPDYTDYIPYFNILKEKYNDKIKITFGVEIGLENKWKNIINEFSTKYDFDFIIGSSHATQTLDLYFDQKEYFCNKTKKEAYTIYFEEILKNINTCPNFNVYGHIDYISRYGMYEDNSLEYKDYSDLIDNCLKALINKNKGIEVNTSGFRYGINCTYPSLTILKRYKALGGEIITAGSDSHKPEDVADHIDYAYALIKEAGFKYINVFRKQKAEFIKI